MIFDSYEIKQLFVICEVSTTVYCLPQKILKLLKKNYCSQITQITAITAKLDCNECYKILLLYFCERFLIKKTKKFCRGEISRYQF